MSTQKRENSELNLAPSNGVPAGVSRRSEDRREGVLRVSQWLLVELGWNPQQLPLSNYYEFHRTTNQSLLPSNGVSRWRVAPAERDHFKRACFFSDHIFSAMKNRS